MRILTIDELKEKIVELERLLGVFQNEISLDELSYLDLCVYLSGLEDEINL